MPTISSPLGSKTVQGGMREFTVADESESEMMHQYPPYEAPRQVDPIRQSIEMEKAMQARKSPEKSKISEAGRRRVEMLCGMSKVTRQVDIDGNAFVLRTLKGKESREVLAEAIKYDGTIEFTYELRRRILARSIEQVAGIDIDVFLGTLDFDAKLDFIDELDDAIGSKLYAEYLSLNDEVKNKYAAKNEKEVLGLVEDVKKS